MIYFLFGENSFTLNQEVDHLVDGYGNDVLKIEGANIEISDLADIFGGVTLFSNERMIILKNVSENKDIWSILPDWLDRGAHNDLVFVESEVDKRTKTYKWLYKNAKKTEFKNLSQGELVHWITNVSDGSLTHLLANFLVERVGTNQWRLLSEVSKLRLANRPLDEKIIADLVEPTMQATSFDLLGAVFQGDQAKINNLIIDIAEKEDPYKFIGLLSSQIYAILLVKTANGTKGASDIAKEASIHPFVVQKASSFADKVSLEELKSLQKRLARLDFNTKSLSINPWEQITLFLKSVA